MTLLLNCQSLSQSFGSRTLFEELSLSVFAGNRVGLIGPNGVGKTTLLKILAGYEKPSAGVIAPKRGLKIGYVPQTSIFPDKTPSEVLWEAISSDKETPEYEKEVRIETWLTKLGFSGQEPSALRLSGGWKKRLSLAQALLLSPELLLLDEPTNHLDLEGILWLEKFLLKEISSFVLVSHDRYFLQNMINRVIEINPVYPQGLLSIEGSYRHFLEKKESFLLGQLEQQRSIASKARKELDWLRQSPKARTSKSKSRVEDAHALLEELSQIKQRNQQKTASVNFSTTARETQKLLVAKNISKTLDRRLLFSHLDFTLSPGTRMGLMGPNGAGKTTLLQIIAGEKQTDQGTIKRADELKIVYFDQHRAQLPDRITLKEALSPKGDFVYFRGQMIHVNGWCKRFLFSPDILDMPLDKLSGGERARIAIAHLMLQPADILLLDEPTNDLDIPTLEILEDSLLEFPGAIVLITHDRCLLDRVSNTLLALGNPTQNTFFADYAQWERAQQPIPLLKKELPQQPSMTLKSKRSYQEQKEYAQIEGKITQLEQKIQSLHLTLEDPAIAQDTEQLQALCTEIGLIEIQIEQLYLRWTELDR